MLACEDTGGDECPNEICALEAVNPFCGVGEFHVFVNCLNENGELWVDVYVWAVQRSQGVSRVVQVAFTDVIPR